MQKFKEGQKLICPQCGSEQEELVDDYIIPGKTGAASACVDNCSECHASFEVECTGSGDYVVRQV